MKRIWKAYFTFSKKERLALVMMLALMAIFLAMPYFYVKKNEPPLVSKALAEFVLSGKQIVNEENRFSLPKDSLALLRTSKSDTKISFVIFNPNIPATKEWEQFGLRDKTIQTIHNYLQKGGRFQTPDDIRKIWGLRKEVADLIIPYLNIPFSKKPVLPSTHYLKTKDPDIGKTVWVKQKPSVIDINKATIENWESLPGIGEVLATRIVKFRDRVGGFVSIEQVKKTYGISDSVFLQILPFLKLETNTGQQININLISAYDLHIRADLPERVAKSIIAYRQQYGPFKQPADLKKIVFMTDSLYVKLLKWVTIE